MAGYNPAEYKIWTRSNFGRLEQVQNGSSFKCNLKWGDVSTWELIIPMSEYHRAYETGGAVGSTYIFQLGGIVVYRDDDFLIGGPIISANRKAVGDDDVITLSGASDTHWLSQRIIWPNPDREYQQAGAENEWFEGDGVTYCPAHHNTSYPGNDPAGDIMHAYVSTHIGTLAWHGTLNTHAYDRRMQWTYGGVTKYLQVEPLNGYGPQTTYSGRLETLLEVCKNLSHISDNTSYVDSVKDEVDFGVTNVLDGFISFDTYAVVDKSTTALFGTDLGTIRSFEITETRPDYNALFVGGDEHVSGDIGSRKFIYTQPAAASDSQSIYGRIEGFYDFSIAKTDDTAAQKLQDMVVAGRTESNTHSYNIVVKLVLEDSDMVKFIDQYNIGDLVTVQFEDYSYTDLIREIDITVDPSGGEVIEPIVCNSKAYRGSGGVADRNRDARRALLALQRMK